MAKQTLKEKALKRIRAQGRGQVFTPKDFLDLGERGPIGRVLSELVELGEIRRIGWGLYDYPRTNERLGIVVSPDPDRIAGAIARQTGSEVTPSGAVAANQLGLTTQVPAKLIYLTNGKGRTVQVGKQTFVLKGVVPKDFESERSKAAVALRALKYLGREAVTAGVKALLRQKLSQQDRRELLRRSAYRSDWIRAVSREIAGPEGVENG